MLGLQLITVYSGTDIELSQYIASITPQDIFSYSVGSAADLVNILGVSNAMRTYVVVTGDGTTKASLVIEFNKVVNINTIKPHASS